MPTKIPRYRTCLLGATLNNGVFGYCLAKEEDLFNNIPEVSILVPFPLYGITSFDLNYIKNYCINKLYLTILDKKPITEYTKYEIGSPTIEPLYEDLLFTREIGTALECLKLAFSSYTYCYCMSRPKNVGKLLFNLHKPPGKVQLSVTSARDVVPADIKIESGVYIRLFDKNHLYFSIIFSNEGDIMSADGNIFQTVNSTFEMFSTFIKVTMDSDQDEIKKLKSEFKAKKITESKGKQVQNQHPNLTITQTVTVTNTVGNINPGNYQNILHGPLN